MKHIHVSAAMICDNLTRPAKVFATARGYGAYKGQWEFPGGKIEPGETPEQALVREIREELNTEIRIGEHIATVEWDYPEFHLTMECYLCEVLSGALTLKEAEAAKWLPKSDLCSVPWLPADRSILSEIEKRMAPSPDISPRISESHYN